MDFNQKYNDNWIYGYKMFKDNLTNQYGEKFEIGKIYKDPNIGKKYGFHFCKNIEDTMIFSNYGGYKDSNLEFYEVCGKGMTFYYENDYVGLYDVYATEELKVLKKLMREEILDIFLLMDPYFGQFRLERFLSLFKLNDEEILLFKKKFINDNKILRMITYFQENDKDAFIKKRIK